MKKSHCNILNHFLTSKMFLTNWIHLLSLTFLLMSSIVSEGKQRVRSSDHRQMSNFYGKQNNSNSSSAFLQIPHSNPPTVRDPPYAISQEKCPSINTRENWVGTLCGDLNTGFIPQNPLGHKFVDGGTYPFDTIKNKTLDFFRRALPILKKNKSLPKVARYSSADFHPPNTSQNHRKKRGIATREPAYPSPLLDPYFPDDIFYPDISSSSRRRRQYGPGPSQNNHNRFCENAMNYYNRLCKIYNSMWGKVPHNIQREASMETHRYYHPNQQSHGKNSYQRNLRPSIDVTVIEPTKSAKNLNISPTSQSSAIDMPPTPCPSSAEYMTPVFARNHEGAWRYVVQIPKEGYFTQTVEVTKCLRSNCFYIESGSCKTSPRWQSLLVAELYYPDASFPTTRPNESENELKNSKNRRSKMDSSQCDGVDNIGCYQVRLFYDWFLIPGSCKCWMSPFDFTKRVNS